MNSGGNAPLLPRAAADAGNKAWCCEKRRKRDARTRRIDGGAARTARVTRQTLRERFTLASELACGLGLLPAPQLAPVNSRRSGFAHTCVRGGCEWRGWCYVLCSSGSAGGRRHSPGRRIPAVSQTLLSVPPLPLGVLRCSVRSLGEK